MHRNIYPDIAVWNTTSGCVSPQVPRLWFFTFTTWQSRTAVQTINGPPDLPASGWRGKLPLIDLVTMDFVVRNKQRSYPEPIWAPETTSWFDLYKLCFCGKTQRSHPKLVNYELEYGCHALDPVRSCVHMFKSQASAHVGWFKHLRNAAVFGCMENICSIHATCDFLRLWDI